MIEAGIPEKILMQVIEHKTPKFSELMVPGVGLEPTLPLPEKGF